MDYREHRLINRLRPEPKSRREGSRKRSLFIYRGYEYSFSPRQLELLFVLRNQGELGEGYVVEQLWPPQDRAWWVAPTPQKQARLRKLQSDTNASLLRRKIPLQIVRADGGGFLHLKEVGN